MSKFTVAGVSTQHGITKVRFANDIVSRTKLLAKGGHSPLELVELPKAMTKAEACQHLLDTGGVFTQWAGLLIETMAKKEGTSVVKATKTTKVVPVKSKATATKQPKISKPKVEEDLEVTEIKELADAPF